MKWKEAAAAAAPILTSVLPPPFNMMAHYAVRDALGLKREADDRIIEQMIQSGDPGVIAKIKQAELQLIKHAQSMDVDLEQLLQKDRESARHYANSTKSLTPAVLTWTALCMLAVELLYLIYMGGVPDSLDNAFGGALLLAPLTLAQQGFNFFLGSSVGSMQKNHLMAFKRGGKHE